MKKSIFLSVLIVNFLISSSCNSASTSERSEYGAQSYAELIIKVFENTVHERLPEQMNIKIEEYDLSTRGILFSGHPLVYKITCTPSDEHIFPYIFYISEWGDASCSLSEASFQEVDLVLVTPLIYVFYPIQLSTGSFKIHSDINDIFNEVVFASKYSTTIREYLNSPLPANFRPLQVQDKAASVLITIALPGSHIPDNNILSALAPGKTIVLTAIPETGPIKTRIIPPPETAESLKLKKNLLDLLHTALTSAGDREKLRSLKQEIDTLAARPVPGAAQKAEAGKNLMYQLAGIEPGSLDYVYIDSYTEKISPDTIMDYNSEKAELTKSIPGATLENLPDLLFLFETFQPQAIASPGKYEDGRIMLGADPKQYVPGDEELVVSEIGDRIAHIAVTATAAERQAALKKAGISRRSITSLLSGLIIKHPRTDTVGEQVFEITEVV